MADESKPVTALSVPPKPQEAAQLPALVQEVKRDPYAGASSKPCSQEQGQVLMAPIASQDVEIRPDGIIYLPEIKYRRVLNRAFGPMGWSLIPRDAVTMQGNTMTRAYALVVDGRFVSEARGEMEYIANNDQMTYATTTEGVKSNALMRCCKDLGIASELWDPGFIEGWKREFAVAVWVESKNKPQWRRKDRQPFYKETGPVEKSHAQNVPAAVPKAQPASPFVKPKVIEAEPIVIIPTPPAAAPPAVMQPGNLFAVITGLKKGKGGTRRDGTAWSQWFIDYVEPTGEKGSQTTFEEDVAAEADFAMKDGVARLIVTETKDGKTKIVKLVSGESKEGEDLPF